MSKEVLTIDLDWIESPRQEIEIISLCTKLFKKKVDTYFIKAHHHAYDLVPEKATLYNVDHHHDFCYSRQGILEVESGLMREGNWVLALAMYKKLEAYTWIKNYDSDLQETQILPLYRRFKRFKIYNSLKDLTVKKLSRLIICESASYNKNLYDLGASYNKNISLGRVYDTLLQLSHDLDVNPQVGYCENDYAPIRIEVRNEEK